MKQNEQDFFNWVNIPHLLNIRYKTMQPISTNLLLLPRSICSSHSRPLSHLSVQESAIATYTFASNWRHYSCGVVTLLLYTYWSPPVFHLSLDEEASWTYPRWVRISSQWPSASLTKAENYNLREGCKKPCHTC